MYTYEPKQGDVDVIFAGGGTAACVAAGRLARSDPNTRILIIERGKNNLNDTTVVNPALFAVHLMPGSSTAMFYHSKTSPDVAGREVVVPAGGILGGGSSINLSMYTRAQAEDYDAWEAPGWEAKDMIPLCNKLENYQAAAEAGVKVNHGDSGPVKVSDGGFRSMSEHAVMDTIRQLGMEELNDINDFATIGGFMKIPRYVSPDGQRQDAAHCYIHPLLQDRQGHSLFILLRCTVTRIIFDESATPPRAIGVEYRSTDSIDSPPQTVCAKKLVVVSSGALGSPQVLERSGIGNSSMLESLGIPIVSDLTGVGENYQDHHLVSSSYKTTLPPEETLDSLASGRKNVAQAISSRDPQLGWNTIDVAGKLCPNNLEAKELGPEFFEIWKRDWATHRNKPMIIMNFINTFVGNPAGVAGDQQHLTIGSIGLYPYSRGSIHITGREQGYDFSTGFLSHNADVKTQVWGYKRARCIARQLPFFAGEVAASHPRYAEGSAASVVTSASVVNAEIAYTAEDDAAIERWIRQSVGTTWHSLGTCAMRPRKAGGVVDPRLNVYGTQSLKVADLSIAPENIGANVGNTAFAIGEKAALIISEELGIS